jgi:hypothetical protein
MKTSTYLTLALSFCTLAGATTSYGYGNDKLASYNCYRSDDTARTNLFCLVIINDPDTDSSQAVFTEPGQNLGLPDYTRCGSLWRGAPYYRYVSDEQFSAERGRVDMYNIEQRLQRRIADQPVPAEHTLFVSDRFNAVFGISNVLVDERGVPTGAQAGSYSTLNRVGQVREIGACTLSVAENL